MMIYSLYYGSEYRQGYRLKIKIILNIGNKMEDLKLINIKIHKFVCYLCIRINSLRRKYCHVTKNNF